MLAIMALSPSARYWLAGESSALPLWVYERRRVPAGVDRLALVPLERSDLEQQRELVPQVRLHHLRAVGGDRERHAPVGERPHRLPQSILVSQRPRQQVRARADLENGVGLEQEAHRLLVLRGEDAVADALGAEVLDDLADLLDPVPAALLADVDRHAQAGAAGLLDERRELAVGEASAVGPRAGDVDADDAPVGVADRLLDDDPVLLVRERPVHHQDEAGAHLRVLELRAVEPARGGHDDVVEVLLAAAVSLHRVEAELERRDVLRPVGAADRAVDGALDG